MLFGKYRLWEHIMNSQICSTPENIDLHFSIMNWNGCDDELMSNAFKTIKIKKTYTYVTDIIGHINSLLVGETRDCLPSFFSSNASIHSTGFERIDTDATFESIVFWLSFCILWLFRVKLLFFLLLLKSGIRVGLWCLTPLSTIFQLYGGGHKVCFSMFTFFFKNSGAIYK